MNLKHMLAIGTCAIGLAVAAPTLAQEATATASATPAPQANATAQAEANFSDGEVKQFASAALAVQQIRADTATTDADKQPKMAAAVQASGLTPQRFNEIAQASQNDAELTQRIQAAATAAAPATPATPATPAAPATPATP